MHWENNLKLKKMENDKKLTDNEIITTLISVLKVSITEFRTKLGYKSNSTIYLIQKGHHNVSGDMINRIISQYPNVSFLYLKKGTGLPLISGPTLTNQANVLGTYNEFQYVSMADFLKLPAVVEELRLKVKSLEKEVQNIKKGAN